MEQLISRLRNLQAEEMAAHSRAGLPISGSHIYGSAFEVRTAEEQYFWHGLKRGGDPEHPVVILQYTLEGMGEFAEKHTKRKIEPQMAFTAIVPSDHAYYLPTSSASWSFFWLIIRHPYIVSRIEQRVKTVGSLLRVSADSLFVTRAYSLLASMYQAPFQDPFGEEQALFDFLIEYERTAFHLLHPSSEREQLFQSVRACVLRALPQPLEVEWLAERYGMSRSHFSHCFKRATGATPAQFMTQVRLDEAIYALLYTRQGLEEIAAATGFADANHLCKTFRRQMHTSPGEFRRQMCRSLPAE
ncbi:MAG TPA: helix-turn-helix domain-containing protein [Ktedonobacteraceae bacterium]|jgi:AraC-like DNA-binding protein